jgi:guanylate kinase
MNARARTITSYLARNSNKRFHLAIFWNTPKCLGIITAHTAARSMKPRPRERTWYSTIFILAPSRQVLEQRLRARSEDTDAVIERRLRDAAQEIRNYSLYDYVVINKDLDQSAETLEAIVRAERARRTRIEDQIRPILATFEKNV